MYSKHPVRRAWLAGFVFHCLSFYWLSDTLAIFGGFPKPIAMGLNLLFAAISSLQFGLFAWLALRWKDAFGPRFSCLIYGLAWFLGEYFVPRIFPWYLASSQLPWSEFCGLAEFVGIYPLSVLMIVISVATIRAFESSSGVLGVIKAMSLPVALLVCATSLGSWRSHLVAIDLDTAQKVSVALIQGNLSLEKKGQAAYFDSNIDAYRDLTRKAVTQQGAELVIWPESIMSSWMPEKIKSLEGTSWDIRTGKDAALLIGALTYRERDPRDLAAVLARMPESLDPRVREEMRYLKYNSATGIYPDGKIAGTYHKQVLMPFGEYLPLSERFPVLRSLSPNSGDFSVGDLSPRIDFVIPRHGERGEESITVRVGPLICYEDLVANMGRKASLAGANLLVNLTNDAWYGPTSAPYQHNLLASWRAIETRRMLLRATNTGLSAIIDPFGVTKETLDLFSRGLIISSVPLLDTETFYTLWGDLPILLCAVFLLFVLILKSRWSGIS